MDVLYERCAGLDVHKKTVVACVLTPGTEKLPRQETRSFSTMTVGLEQLRAWLAECGCTHVAMEATGVYWKPIYNVLEGQFTLLVVNAEHMHAVPGRKTDIKDAEWIATLLRHGLVRGSFIPDHAQRELRELTRYRTALIRERAREVNRLQKTLEGANIKLAAVLTDIMGVSGQRILDALVAADGDHDPEALAALAHWRLKKKREALEQALEGQVSALLRFVIRQQLTHMRSLDQQIAECDRVIAEQLRPFAEELARMEEIPGVGVRTSQTLVAEIGTDLSRFPSAGHLAAWAGVAPGNRKTGGKARPAKTRKGSPWLRAALTEAGWAAGRCRDSYLAAQYQRLAARRGRKRAVVAVGHSILVIIYHLLTKNVAYADLGETFFDERRRAAVERDAIKRLRGLGYDVTLTPTAAA
ncbi:MAG: IS110 family RNA-guided transposase [Candidatus Limnocylindrales bacterium]